MLAGLYVPVCYIKWELKSKVMDGTMMENRKRQRAQVVDGTSCVYLKHPKAVRKINHGSFAITKEM